MTSRLPINLHSLLHQRHVEGERIECKVGWNPDPILRTLCAFANDSERTGESVATDLYSPMHHGGSHAT